MFIAVYYVLQPIIPGEVKLMKISAATYNQYSVVKEVFINGLLEWEGDHSA